MLPADTAGYGFDNNADALTLSPALTERYLNAAAKISQMALERPRGMPTPETFFEPTDRSQAAGSAMTCRSAPAADWPCTIFSCRRRLLVRDSPERERRQRVGSRAFPLKSIKSNRHRQRQDLVGRARRAGIVRKRGRNRLGPQAGYEKERIRKCSRR